MACILLCSSAVKVHDSQAYRKMDVTRERVSRILELREMLLSFQTGFNLVSAAVVCAKVQQAIVPHEDLLTTVKRRKLQWYGHVYRPSGLAKTILQSTAKGGRSYGRQRKRWEDNIREWTGLEFAKSRRAVENRGKWRKLVVKSSLVPKQPLQLRDR